VETLAPESIVSTNPQKYGTYGVDSTARVIRIATQSGDSLRLVLGKQGPDYQSVYVRIQSDPRVFAAKGPVYLPTNLDTWRDKIILTFGPPAQLARVEVKTGEEQYVVVASGGQWNIKSASGTVPADSAAVARWMARFNPLRADGFIADGRPAQVRENAGGHVKLVAEDGRTDEIWLSVREKDIAIVSNDSPDVFKLYSYHQANLLPPEKSLHVREK